MNTREDRSLCWWHKDATMSTLTSYCETPSALRSDLVGVCWRVGLVLAILHVDGLLCGVKILRRQFKLVRRVVLGNRRTLGALKLRPMKVH